ncbi:MAG: hypothetical protein JO345_20090 [Streptosporangiaceae bacterium]|nr:hypothetical protein [Streptosporangiaceae bacterium]
MPVPPQPYQLSRHGWISVAYNQNIWIPCQPVFPEGFDRDSWAKLYAEEWWSRTRQPYGKREIKTMARMLSEIHAYAYSNMAMHMGFLHLPRIGLAPLMVSFGIWEAAGDRSEQLRILTHANDPTTMQPPVIEEFSTEKLGAGIKVVAYTRNKDVVTGYLNYAWRSDEFATAVRMFTGSPDLGRLQQATPDIEELARAAAWVPLKQGVA